MHWKFQKVSLDLTCWSPHCSLFLWTNPTMILLLFFLLVSAVLIVVLLFCFIFPTIVWISCILMLFKQNAKLWYDFNLFYNSKGFSCYLEEYLKWFFLLPGEWFFNHLAKYFCGHLTFLFVHFSNLDFKIFIPYFCNIQIPRFARFDIYLKSSILPPFPHTQDLHPMHK